MNECMYQCACVCSFVCVFLFVCVVWVVLQLLSILKKKKKNTTKQKKKQHLPLTWCYTSLWWSYLILLTYESGLILKNKHKELPRNKVMKFSLGEIYQMCKVEFWQSRQDPQSRIIALTNLWNIKWNWTISHILCFPSVCFFQAPCLFNLDIEDLIFRSRRY